MMRNIFVTSSSRSEQMHTLRELIEMCSNAKYEPLNADMKLGRCAAMMYAGKCTSTPGMLRSIIGDSVSHVVLMDTQQELTERCLTAKYELLSVDISVDMKSEKSHVMPRVCASDAAGSGHAMFLLRCSTRTYTPDQGETTTIRPSESDTDDYASNLTPSTDRERHDNHGLTPAQTRADSKRGVPGHLHAIRPLRARSVMSVPARLPPSLLWPPACDDGLSVSITPDQGESCRASTPEHHMQIIFTETNGSSLNAVSITPDRGENWLSALTAAYNGSVPSSATRVQPFVAMLSAAMPRPEDKLNRHHTLNSSRDVCLRGDLISPLALVAMPTGGDYGGVCTVQEGLLLCHVTTVPLCEALGHDHGSSMRAQLTSMSSWVHDTMFNVAAYVDIRVILPRAEPCREWHALVSACASWEPGPDISISLAVSSCTQPASTRSFKWGDTMCMCVCAPWPHVRARLNSDVGDPASMPRHIDCGAESMARTVARGGKLITVLLSLRGSMLLSLRGSIRPVMRLHIDQSGDAGTVAPSHLITDGNQVCCPIRQEAVLDLAGDPARFGSGPCLIWQDALLDLAVHLTHSGDERDGSTAAAMLSVTADARLVIFCHVPTLALSSWLLTLPIRTNCVYRDYLRAGEALVAGARQSTQLKINDTTMMISAWEADACSGGDCHSALRVQSLVRDFVAEESVCALRVPIRIRGAGKAGDAGDHDLSLQVEEPKWLSEAWNLVSSFPDKSSGNALDYSLNGSLESSRGDTVLEDSTGKNAQSLVQIPAVQATSDVVSIVTDIVTSLVDDMVLANDQADELLLGATLAMVVTDSVAVSELASRVRSITGVAISPSDMLEQTLDSIAEHLLKSISDEPYWLREAHDSLTSADSMPMMVARHDSRSVESSHSIAETGLKEGRNMLPASSDCTPDSTAHDESASKVAVDHPVELPCLLDDGDSTSLTAARKRAKRRGGAGSDQRRREKHGSSMGSSQCDASVHQGEVQPSLQCSLMVTKDGCVQVRIRPTTSEAMPTVYLVLFTGDMYGAYRVFMSKHSLFQVRSTHGERLSESVLRCSRQNFGIPDDSDPQYLGYDLGQLKWVTAIEEAQKSSEGGPVTPVVSASKNSIVVIGHVDEHGAGQKPPFDKSCKDYRPRGRWCLAETACDRIYRSDPDLADAVGSALRSQGWKPELSWQEGKASIFEDDSESRICDSSYSDIPNSHSSHINSTYASHVDDRVPESNEHVSADRDSRAEDSYDEDGYDVNEVSDGDGDSSADCESGTQSSCKEDAMSDIEDDMYDANYQEDRSSDLSDGCYYGNDASYD